MHACTGPSQDKDKKNRAVQLAEINARQYPRSAAALSTLGWVYYRMGRAADAEQALRSHSWPGNVRELMNAIEVAFAYGDGDEISVDDLPTEVTGRRPSSGVPNRVNGTSEPAPIPTFEESERLLLQRALDSTGGNKLQAAKLLGISRKQLYAKIKKYEIEVP